MIESSDPRDRQLVVWQRRICAASTGLATQRSFLRHRDDPWQGASRFGVHRSIRPMSGPWPRRVCPESWTRGKCTRESALVSARFRASRLLLPRPDAPAHFFIGNGAPCIGISETSKHHGVEGQLPDDLFPGAVFRLLLDKPGQLFLGRHHWQYLQAVLKGATSGHVGECHIRLQSSGKWRTVHDPIRVRRRRQTR